MRWSADRRRWRARACGLRSSRQARARRRYVARPRPCGLRRERDAEQTNSVDHRTSAVQRVRRREKRGEHAVPDRLDEGAAESVQLLRDDMVMAAKLVEPGDVAVGRVAGGGSRDVGEQHREQCAASDRVSTLPSEELFDLTQDGVAGTAPQHVIG